MQENCSLLSLNTDKKERSIQGCYLGMRLDRIYRHNYSLPTAKFKTIGLAGVRLKKISTMWRKGMEEVKLHTLGTTELENNPLKICFCMELNDIV